MSENQESQLYLDQKKIRIDGHNHTEFTQEFARRVAEVVAGGCGNLRPVPEKKSSYRYILQSESNNHWLRWNAEERCWILTFRYPLPQSVLDAIKVVVEELIAKEFQKPIY